MISQTNTLKYQVLFDSLNKLPKVIMQAWPWLTLLGYNLLFCTYLPVRKEGWYEAITVRWGERRKQEHGACACDKRNKQIQKKLDTKKPCVFS